MLNALFHPVSKCNGIGRFLKKLLGFNLSVLGVFFNLDLAYVDSHLFYRDFE